MLQYKLEKPTLINLLFLRLNYLWYLNFKEKQSLLSCPKHFIDTISTSTLKYSARLIFLWHGGGVFNKYMTIFHFF